MGAGFDRPADVDYWTLRFPRIRKIHDDRTWKDVVSFDELQHMGRDCQHPLPEHVDQRRKLWLARLGGPHRQAQDVDNIPSQETSESSESSESQTSIGEDQAAQVQTRSTSMEIADSQPDNIVSSSVVSVQKRARSQSPSEISPPRKRIKQIKPTSHKSTNEARMSITSRTPGLTTSAKLGQASTNSSFEQNMHQAAQGSELTLASQISPSNPHPQTSRFSTHALVFLSKLRMPLLVCKSSKDYFFSPCQAQFDIPITFTFSTRFFIQSVLGNQTQEESGRDRKSCWHVVMVRLEEYQSFSAQVQTLVAMVEKQHNAAPGDFHILFADGCLFQLLAGDDDRQWQDTMRAYLRFAARKVVEIIYGVRFRADFLQGIR
jgi:hypothetical protein